MSTASAWIIMCLITCVMLRPATILADDVSIPPTDARALVRQLADLRDEIKALRQEVGQLRQAVTEIHRATVAVPTVAPPEPEVTSLTLDSNPAMGDTEAKVAIVEFSDYQCPFCRRFHEQTFVKLKATYVETGQVQYVFRDFPLDFHPEATGAAVAANCAGEQGAYWDMHHALFSQQRNLSTGLYMELAQTFELNIPAFQSCLNDPTQAQEVQNDLTYGQKLGVQGTPSFFVGRLQNGRLIEARKITGAQPWPVFVQAIDALLR